MLEQTINSLNSDTALTRKSVKPAFASLTIGSGSCAWLLVHRSLSNGGTPLEVAIAEARTEFHDLCCSDNDSAGSAMQPLMDTDSEELMRRGIETGKANFGGLLTESGWKATDIQKTICHQVGGTHRKLMLESLQLDPESDFTSFEILGNTGAAALPVTLAMAVEQGAINKDENVGLLGIGSGINCVMLGVHWQATPVRGAVWEEKLASTSTLKGPHAAGRPAGDIV